VERVADLSDPVGGLQHPAGHDRVEPLGDLARRCYKGGVTSPARRGARRPWEHDEAEGSTLGNEVATD
jgi:hypothetical protein